MALLIAVSGPYTSAFTAGASATTATGSGVSLGITADDGYRLMWTIHKQQLGGDGTDIYGQSRLENVIRGADWNLLFRSREFGANVWAAAWPYGRSTLAGANAVMSARMAQAGAQDDTSGFTGSIVLTVVAGTPAATLSAPTSLTAAKAIQAGGQQQAIDFTSKERQTPQNFELLPYSQTVSATTNTLWWSAA